MTVITSKEERIIIHANGDVRCGDYKTGSCKDKIVRNAKLPIWALKGLENGQWLVIDMIKVITEDVVTKNRWGELVKTQNIFPKVIGKMVTPSVERIPETYTDINMEKQGLVETTKSWNNIFNSYGDFKIKVGSDDYKEVKKVLISRQDIDEAEAWCEAENAAHPEYQSSTPELVGENISVDTDSLPMDKLAEMSKGNYITCNFNIFPVKTYKNRVVDNSWYVSTLYGKLAKQQKTANYLDNWATDEVGDPISINATITCITWQRIKHTHRNGDDGNDGWKMGISSDSVISKTFKFDYNDQTHHITFEFND